MPTPNFGFTYPTSGDHTRTWEYWQSLAEQVDAALQTLVGGAITAIAGVVAGAGWTIVAEGQKIGTKLAYVQISATRTGAVIGPGGATGNISDVTVATLPVGWRPSKLVAIAMSGPDQTAPNTGAITPAGVVLLQSLGNSAVTVTAPNVVTFACCMPL